MTRQEYIRISLMLDELDILYSEISRLRSFSADGNIDGTLHLKQGAVSYDVSVGGELFAEIVQKLYNAKVARREMLESEFKNL